MTFLSSVLSDRTPAFPKKTFMLAGVLAVLLYIADQISKSLIVSYIPFGTRNVVIPGFFNITHVLNKGAAWGILQGRLWLLLAISLAATGLIFTFFRFLTENYKERFFALMLIVSGIFGNCTDRIFRGAVVDFLEFYIGRFVWPSFNIADICICTGTCLFVLSSLIRPERKKFLK